MTGRQDVFQQAMNDGHSAAWDQYWDRAAAFYRKALDEFPEHPQALTSLGLALFEMQDYEQSLQTYLRAARSTPNDPLPLEKVAQLYERIGNLENACQTSLAAAELYMKNKDVNKAIENWLRVTRLKPDNLQAHSRLALVYERMSDKPKAVAGYLAVASLLQSLGDIEKAVRAVNQALQIMPDSDEVAIALKNLRDKKPLPKPSRPRGGTAPLLMSQVRQLDTSKSPAESEKGLDPIAQARQRALTVLAGMLFEGTDEDESGKRDLQAIVRGEGNLPRPVDRARIILHLSQVVDLQTNGDNAAAAEELEKAIEAGLEHPGAFFDLGLLHAESGRLESAIRNLQQSVHHPDLALGAHLQMAELYKKTRRMSEAALEYLEALKEADILMVPEQQAGDLRQLYEPLLEGQQQATDAEQQATLADNIHSLLLRPDWREQLAKARQQLPKRSPGSPPVPLAEILTQARSSQIIDSMSHIYDLAERGDLLTAMEEAFYALQGAPTYLPLHTYMGEMLIKQGHLQEAIAKYLVVARAYAVRGEGLRAVDMYRRIINMAPMDMNSRKMLIDMLIERGQVEQGIEEYLSLAEVYYKMADLEMVRKTYTESLRLAQQSKVDRSYRVRIMHGMADIDLQSLDWRQALRIYEQIRTMQPDDEKARASLIDLNYRLGHEPQALAELDNYLAYLTNAGQLDRGIKMVETMLNENGERMQIRRRLAELYRQAGRISEAIQQLDTLADALLTSENKGGAIEVIQAILALNPPNKAQYQQVLVQIRGR